MSISRRSFLSGGFGLAAWAAVGPRLHAAPAHAAARAVDIEGTTLAQSARKATAEGYSRLVAGPGLPLIVRHDLAAALPARDERREALSAFVQLTDLHFIDAQSPMRFEWLHQVNGSAFRPQEALGTRANAALIDRINALPGGPYSGRTFDAVVCTGDNTDNMETIELDWFLNCLSGGAITPNTGDPTAWEGVQSRNNLLFWTPETSLVDDYKQQGFPQLAGYFARATAPHISAGLNTPWYSVFGNHDNSIQGTLPADWNAFVEQYTGDQKLLGFRYATDAERAAAMIGRGLPINLADAAMITQPVTPDEARRPFSPREYMYAHLAADVTGPGPVGHGFSMDNVLSGVGYYTFPLAEGVTGIAMDSTNRAGFTDGSIDDVQWHWLHQTLRAGSSRYYDWLGRRVSHWVDDQLFVLFSHHTSDTMGNLLLPADGTGIRHSGLELRQMLSRYPNVIAWVNGHTHENRITPRPHRDPRRAWWEINTAAHIDYPQHARILEVCDNRDGTLSIFTTLVEALAPYQADYDSTADRDLASLYRELAYNDPHCQPGRLGTPADCNTELLLTHPLV